MIGLLIRISLAVLVFYHLFTPVAALRPQGGDYSNERGSEVRVYKNPQNSEYNRMSGSIPGKTTRRGLGISAWGIIAVILGMIFAGVGVYYFSMCYPILCKKERKYDRVDIA